MWLVCTGLESSESTMTYPYRDEPEIDTFTVLRRLLDQAWQEADRARMQCEPGTQVEADWLAMQHAIENLQGT